MHHLNCIIEFLFGTQPMHMTFTFVALFLEKCDFIAKILIYVELRIRFYLFSTNNKKYAIFFRKPTSNFL